MPAILMFCIIGSFAINNTVFDIGTMLVMGVAGYFLETAGYPVAPIVLGLVLGPILEQNFMTSMIKLDWDLPLFFSRPIGAVLGGITVLIWFFPFLAAFLEKTKKRNNGKVQ
jgi:putative tricarboxylic transport membrane protein